MNETGADSKGPAAYSKEEAMDTTTSEWRAFKLAAVQRANENRDVMDGSTEVVANIIKANHLVLPSGRIRRALMASGCWS